ncbi:MAG TPA: hypothetical protein DIT64_12965 [Verrucomicrobiales bacterium]|nr:hypothetical protein [Verrucomicrobiales bacterium]
MGQAHHAPEKADAEKDDAPLVITRKGAQKSLRALRVAPGPGVLAQQQQAEGDARAFERDAARGFEVVEVVVQFLQHEKGRHRAALAP